jgi:hypothetical protein
MARLNANVSDYVFWSISRCYPVRDKRQTVSIGDGIDRKNCRTVCHDRFEDLHSVFQSDTWIEGLRGGKPAGIQRHVLRRILTN